MMLQERSGESSLVENAGHPNKIDKEETGAKLVMSDVLVVGLEKPPAWYLIRFVLAFHDVGCCLCEKASDERKEAASGQRFTTATRSTNTSSSIG
jgi:hypothetical protein